jgi:heptosyltransferase I
VAWDASVKPLRDVGIVMLSTAGGAVWTLPVVNAIKRTHPDARISWIMQPGAATLVEGHPAVDEIVPFDRGAGVPAFARFRSAMGARRFDAVLVLQSYLKAGLVGALMRADVRLGIDRARARDFTWLLTNRRLDPHVPGHMQDQYLEFLDALGVAGEPLEYHLGPWDAERAWQREFFSTFERPAVALVIGTTKREKDWMPERWAQLSDALWHEFGLEPVLAGGRSERELHAEQVIQSVGRRVTRGALGSGLRRLVSILDGSALVISPDTGPLHMSVALSKPVVSLMGHTNPKRTGPYRQYHDLMVDAFGDPGEAYDAAARNRPDRMGRITVRDVLDRVERWKSNYSVSSGPNR